MDDPSVIDDADGADVRACPDGRGRSAPVSGAEDGAPTASPDAELVAFGIEHDRPARPVTVSMLDDLRAEFDQAPDLGLRLLGSKVDMHAALGHLRLRNPVEEHPSQAPVIRGLEGHEVVLLHQHRVAGHRSPELREPSWIVAVAGDVRDEGRHRSSPSGEPPPDGGSFASSTSGLSAHLAASEQLRVAGQMLSRWSSPTALA